MTLLDASAVVRNNRAKLVLNLRAHCEAMQAELGALSDECKKAGQSTIKTATFTAVNERIDNAWRSLQHAIAVLDADL